LNRTLKGWLELIRPPNLFTVPGDPIAGFILAGGGADGAFRPAALVALAACLLYMAGLIWNDCADAREDARTRPTRPIPSGRVRRGHALAVATTMAAGAVALAWRAAPAAGCVALLLTGLVLTYNFLARRHVAAGVITMGLCRGVSVLLGSVAAWGMRTAGIPADAVTTHGVARVFEPFAIPPSGGHGVLPWLAAGGIMLYIIAVSLLAHGETRRQRLGVKPWLPAATAALLFVVAGRSNVYAAGFAVTAMAWLLLRGLALRGEPQPAEVQRTIGCMIRTLLLLQAGLCALMPETGLMPAMLLLAAWPLAAMTGRLFYGS
jgi:4-hydroxybenzoate polyprenyltransferase